MANRRSRQNQIKRLRAENKALSRDLALVKSQKELYKTRLEEWATEIAGQLGDCSVFNEQLKVVQQRSFAPVINIAVSPRYYDYSKLGPNLDAGQVITAFIRSVHIDPDPYMHSMRVILKDKDGHTSYAITDETRKSIRDVKYIAKMIAEKMYERLS